MSDWMDELGALEDKLEKIKQIAEQEKAIRKDPIGTGSALLKRVFMGG